MKGRSKKGKTFNRRNFLKKGRWYSQKSPVMMVLFTLTEEGRGSNSDAVVEDSTVSFIILGLFRFIQGFMLLDPELIRALTFNLGHQNVPVPECAIHFLPVVFTQHSVPSSNA